MLTVTAQQSRFHNEAIEGSALKELIVKDLSISVGQREVLSHAKLQLQVGMHYVLVGPNGIGKSSLLKAIGTDQIPSIPQNVRVLLLGQTESNLEDDVDKLTLQGSGTVLEHVLRSDKEREALLTEEKALTAGMDDTSDPWAIVRAFRKVSHDRLGKKVDSARKLVLRRSGARGATVRKELLKLEEQFQQSETRLDISGGDASELADETAQAAELLADIETRLQAMGNAAEASADARTVLLGLGFSVESIDKPVSQLSGGWKTRCSLACALCQSCDVLLLDEPTNYLDLPSIIWLERYIESLPPTTTVLVVTHDRSFVDNVAQRLLVLRNQAIEVFKGNLSTYEAERIKTYKYRTRMQEAQDKQKKHIQSTIDANVKAARRAGDDKKLKQAASRKKKLDDRMGLEVSAKGGRFKLNRDLAGYYTKMRADIDVPEFDPPVHFNFPCEPPDLRFPGPLLALENVSFAYGTGKARREILQDINLTVHLGDRIGIAGLNGSGKSTLVSLALAMAATSGVGSGAYKPTKGSITQHPRARFGHFSQKAVDELGNLGTTTPSLTALSYLMSKDMEDKDARALMSGLGLSGRVVSDVPLAALSGGQKARVALAEVLREPSAHLLVLDEPTTHLDSDSITALARALRSYAGALVIVTHDRFFMRAVVEGQSLTRGTTRPEDEDEDGDDSEDDLSSGDESGANRRRVVFRLSKGKLTELKGGMDRYEELAEKAASKLNKA